MNKIKSEECPVWLFTTPAMEHLFLLKSFFLCLSEKKTQIEIFTPSTMVLCTVFPVLLRFSSNCKCAMCSGFSHFFPSCFLGYTAV